MSWHGFRWIGTAEALRQANQQHAEDMAQQAAIRADLQKAALLAKGRA